MGEVKEYALDLYSHEVLAVMGGQMSLLIRPITPQPPTDFEKNPDYNDCGPFSRPGVGGVGFGFCDANGAEYMCPFGGPGGLLWVREMWMPETEQGILTGGIIYHATDQPEPDGDRTLCWLPPTRMHRSASRLTLEVASVRIEQVQNINTEQIISAGFNPTLREHDAVSDLLEVRWQAIWDLLHALRGFEWESNPWAWVVGLKRVEVKAKGKAA